MPGAEDPDVTHCPWAEREPNTISPWGGGEGEVHTQNKVYSRREIKLLPAGLHLAMVRAGWADTALPVARLLSRHCPHGESPFTNIYCARH